MAKKNNALTATWLAGFLAFFAILIKGIDCLLRITVEGDLGMLTMIADTCLVVVVFINAWLFLLKAKLPGKKIVWQIILLVITILVIVGVFVA